jgi:hypothetical protein
MELFCFVQTKKFICAQAPMPKALDVLLRSFRYAGTSEKGTHAYANNNEI